MSERYELQSDNISVIHFLGNCFASELSGEHCHEKYEITYINSARGKILVEGSEYTISHGSIVFIKPASFHKVEIEQTDNIECYTVYFNSSFIPQSLIESIESKSDCESALFYSKGRMSEEIFDIFEKFSLSDSLNESEKKLYMEMLLNQILILLFSQNFDKINRNERELGARVAKYLNANLSKEICLDKLAGRFFVSKYYLCRAFKNYSGISPHAYIVKKRVAHAKQLIESGVTAAVAAEMMGFGDYSAFYRAYTKITGKSPTQE